jgi:hypothetical protein
MNADAHDSRRLLKSAWRISAYCKGDTVAKLMEASRHIAKTFYLSAAVHRRACELALAYGHEELGEQLCEFEKTAYK